MNNQHKYSFQINAVSCEAARILSTLLTLLVELLDSSAPAIRGASVCLLRDFARGKLPPLSLELRMKIAQQLETRLSVETDPFLSDLIVRELALLLEQECESPFVDLEPSEN